MNPAKPTNTHTDSTEIIQYTGFLDAYIVATLLQQLDASLKARSYHGIFRRKAIWILNELASNIILHGNSNYLNLSSIQVRHNSKNQSLILITENFLDRATAEALAEKINHIARMNNHETGKAYRNAMLTADAETPNAGLGLLGIARKCNAITCKTTDNINTATRVQIEVIINPSN